MECPTLNALLSGRSYLHVNGLNCTTMTIDTSLLSLARDARKSCNERQMQQQRERESEQKSKKITEEIDALNKIIQTERQKQQTEICKGMCIFCIPKGARCREKEERSSRNG